MNSKMASGSKDKKSTVVSKKPRWFSDEFWTWQRCRACISAAGHRDHTLTLEGRAHFCKLTDASDAV